jgi:Fic family protein
VPGHDARAPGLADASTPAYLTVWWRMLVDAAELYDLEAVRVAVWAHAEIIRVHPFEDGNGRSRLCANHLLVQLGLRPVAIEAVKQEYTEALNHYYVAGELEPLLDLYLQLYPVGR